MTRPRDDLSFADLRPRSAFLRAAEWVFGVCATIGALAFVLHMIIFFAAFRFGSPSPTGTRTYGLRSHSDYVYVTYPVREAVKYLEITMVLGLGIGCIGQLGIYGVLHVSRPKD